MTLLAAAALLSLQNGHKRTAGVLIGVCRTIKPQWIVIAVWAALRKEWDLALPCAMTFAAGMILSCVDHGPIHWFDYLNALSFMSHHGESNFPNQSNNCLLNRLLFNGDSLRWQAHAFAQYQLVVYLGTRIAALMLLATSLLWRMGGHEPSNWPL